MKQRVRRYLPLVALLSAVGASTFSRADSLAGECAAPHYSIRSQGADSARWLVGLANDYHTNLFQMCELYGTVNGIFEYTKSFRDEDIARCIFGPGLTSNGDCATIKVSGSHVANRGARDWLADYFGLPTDFESCITIKPEVTNYIFELNLWLGFDNWCWEGTYLSLHVPIVRTKWCLNACETVTNKGSLGYDAGYFDEKAVAFSDLNTKATTFLEGNYKLDSIGLKALTTSKWSPCCLDETGLAELRAEFGWNFWQCEDYHVGLNLRVAIPTGTRPDGCHLFEPIVGNGHHFELGAGLSTHVILWRDCECDRYFGFYLDAYATHLFKTNQCRNFDLCGKPNSRYALAMKLGATNPAGELKGNPAAATADPDGFVGPTSGYTDSTYQFQDQFCPVANLTKSKVDVSVGVQGEFTALFDFTSCGFSWDVGYNLWARGCEKIEEDCKCPPTLKPNTWALKGDGHVYGFQLENCNISAGDAALAEEPFALSATQKDATIHHGTNRGCGVALNLVTQWNNPGVDNAQLAYNDAESGTTGVCSPLVRTRIENPPGVSGCTGVVPSDQTRTSIQSVFIDPSEIDYRCARTKGLSHKFFTNLSYTWCENECGWTPYLGVGAKVEWAKGKSDSCDTGCPTTTTSCPTTTSCDPCDISCNTDCGSCTRCSLSEWGVWVKGGFSFN